MNKVQLSRLLTTNGDMPDFSVVCNNRLPWVLWLLYREL